MFVRLLRFRSNGLFDNAREGPSFSYPFDDFDMAGLPRKLLVFLVLMLSPGFNQTRTVSLAHCSVEATVIEMESVKYELPIAEVTLVP